MGVNHDFSRRRFLGSLCAMAGSGAVPVALNLAAISKAAAATAGDYKAIVCLFMSGGNDQGNTVLATDPTSWAEYVRIRSTPDAGNIVLAAPGAPGGVLSITPANAQAGRTFALHPGLGPLKSLFDAGRAAVVANVGPLIQPVTRAQYLAGNVPLPAKLFSHNDQQSTWQALKPEGASTGWGGRMGDLMASTNTNSSFTSVSAGGNTIFLTGRSIHQYQMVAGGAPPIQRLTGSLFGSQANANPLQSIITRTSSNPYENDYAAVVKRAIAAQAVLGSALVPAGAAGVPDPLPYVNPNTLAQSANPLAIQLQTVARMIASRGVLGMGRQVFFVSLGGFDTHDGQVQAHADAMARVAHAIAYFDSTMANLMGGDMRKQVTLFTASDFGRTFTSNGDGTDHGWGSHHFVVGGAVKGKNIYGSFPTTGLGHELDVGSGALLPTSSVDQYGATLASWFGLSATQIADVFPNLRNFSTPNLGFMA